MRFYTYIENSKDIGLILHNCKFTLFTKKINYDNILLKNFDERVYANEKKQKIINNNFIYNINDYTICINNICSFKY